MRCAVLSIGDELVQGRTQDTNAPWLIARLDTIGITVREVRIVGDGITDVMDAITSLRDDHDLIIITGGLGPTDDDRTRDALNALAGGDVERDAAAEAALVARLDRAGVDASEAQRRQADRPASWRSIANANGTAPGMDGMLKSVRVIALPGPPDECRPMIDAHVLGTLVDPALNVQHQHQISCFGLAEAPVAALLGDRLLEGADPATGIRVSRGVVHVHLRSADVELLAREAALIRDRLGACVLPEGCECPADALAASLQTHDMTVATAESCTGGLIGGALTDRAGSSAWYVGGVQAYANSVKQGLLDVPVPLIEEGVVSADVVEAMARGACGATGADAAVSVSGIAGPDGGTADKPVGTVWIGTCVRGSVRSRCVRLPGPRSRVRAWTVHAALTALWWHLEGVDGAMRWDVRS